MADFQGRRKVLKSKGGQFVNSGLFSKNLCGEGVNYCPLGSDLSVLTALILSVGLPVFITQSSSSFMHIMLAFFSNTGDLNCSPEIDKALFHSYLSLNMHFRRF